MAIVISGKLKGQQVRIHQFCNDWFSVIADNSTGIVQPTNIKLTPEEMVEVVAAKKRGDTGQMFVEFELHDDGTFTRLGPPRRRR